MLTQLLEGEVSEFRVPRSWSFVAGLSFAVRVMKAVIFFRNHSMLHLVC
jgi:hypothetical protein